MIPRCAHKLLFLAFITCLCIVPPTPTPCTHTWQVWPHSQEGRGVQAMPVTPHHTFQHAGPWWLMQALLNNSGLLTTNLSEACMVWLDMCVTWACASDLLTLPGLLTAVPQHARAGTAITWLS